MNDFNVNWAETKTSAKGTEYKRATLTDESGKQTENVAVFNFYSKYNDVKPGNIVSGTLVADLFKGKTSYKLEDGKTWQKNTNWKPGGGGGSTVYNSQAMETKKENVHEAQENKALGIKVSSTIRMAVDIAIAEGAPNSTNILKWRTWLWENWDVGNKDVPF